MKRKLIFFTITLATLFSNMLYGQSGGDFEIKRSTISDAGGGFSEGGEFELNGTIGQADAGELMGSTFLLTGGFWIKERVDLSDIIFEDGFE